MNDCLDHVGLLICLWGTVRTDVEKPLSTVGSTIPQAWVLVCVIRQVIII